MTLRDLRDAIDVAINDCGEDALVYLNTNLSDRREVLAMPMMIHSCGTYKGNIVIGPYRMTVSPGPLPDKIYYEGSTFSPEGERYFPDKGVKYWPDNI